MINKLLLTCLQRNKRLIIPALGAFIRKNVDGVGVVLVFVPFLNKDDGILVSALESWAGVDTKEAKEILIEYVDYIKKSLEERGQYIIEGVGVLKYDANRVIYLAKETDTDKTNSKAVKPEETTSSSPDEAKLPQASSVTPEAIKTEEKPEAIIPVIEQPIESMEQSEEDSAIQSFDKTEEQALAKEYIPTTQQQPVVVESKDITSERMAVPGPARTSRAGVRYFSPHTTSDSESSGQQPGNINHIQPTTPPSGHGQQRRNTINQMYGNPVIAEKETPNNTATPPSLNNTTARSTGGRTQHLSGNIYGGTSPQRDTPKKEMPTPRAPQPINSNMGRATTVRPTGKVGGSNKNKKGKDWVLIAAIAAILFTLFVFIYGWIFGGVPEDEINIIPDQRIEIVIPQE